MTAIVYQESDLTGPTEVNRGSLLDMLAYTQGVNAEEIHLNADVMPAKVGRYMPLFFCWVEIVEATP